MKKISFRVIFERSNTIMVLVKIKPLELEKQTAMKGWNRQQLAESSGVSIATIGQIMAGKSCKVKTAVDIAKALDTDFDTLVI